MALEKLVNEGTRVWALWKISETEPVLRSLLQTSADPPSAITNEQKRLEWLTGRVLTQRLLDELGFTFQGIDKNTFGKPSPTGYPFHLSLSHSFPWVAAILDQHNPVGIDLEQPKPKLLRVGPRVLAADELRSAANDIVKHCVYWCAKETMIKIYGKKDLILAENLHVESFELERKGRITGRIIANHRETVIPLWYCVFPEFVLAMSESGISPKA